MGQSHQTSFLRAAFLVLASAVTAAAAPAALVKARRSRVSLNRVFGASRLGPGTRVTFAITAPDHVGEFLSYSLLAHPVIPKPTIECLPPGPRRAVSCRS